MYVSNRVGRSRKFAVRLLPYRERSSAAPQLVVVKEDTMTLFLPPLRTGQCFAYDFLT
jgi:hypothetical protein